MLIALEDDGCLHVYESPEAAALAIEGLDAEKTFRAVFDENAVPYRIQWLSPNTKRRVLGSICVVGSGNYALVPAGLPDVDAFTALLSSARGPIPPEASAALAGLSK